MLLLAGFYGNGIYPHHVGLKKVVALREKGNFVHFGGSSLLCAAFSREFVRILSEINYKKHFISQKIELSNNFCKKYFKFILSSLNRLRLPPKINFLGQIPLKVRTPW